jgi:hypothetical protein
MSKGVKAFINTKINAAIEIKIKAKISIINLILEEIDSGFINAWLSGLMPRGIIVHTNSMMLTIWIFNPYGQTLRKLLNSHQPLYYFSIL